MPQDLRPLCAALFLAGCLAPFVHAHSDDPPSSGGAEAEAQIEEQEEQKLIAAGAKGYPLLCEKLRSGSLSEESVIRILQATKGDKAIVRKTAREILQAPAVDQTEWKEKDKEKFAMKRNAAQAALGETGTAEDLPLLRKSLASSSWRTTAISSLARLGDKRAQFVVAGWKAVPGTGDPFMDDQADELPTEEIVREIPVADRAILDLLLIPSWLSHEEFLKETEKQARKVHAMGKQAYPALRRELLAARSDAIFNPILAALMEGAGDKNPALDLLRQVMRERDNHIAESTSLRVSIIALLAENGGAPERELLHALLKDPDAKVRWAAMRSLAVIGDESSIPPLREWLALDPTNAAFVEEIIQKISIPVEDRKILAMVICGGWGLSWREVDLLRKERQLLAMGTKAYPALCRELERTHDAQAAAAIVTAMFANKKGNKSLPLATLRKVRERNEWSKREDEAHWWRAIFCTLEEFGDKEDLLFIHEFLRTGQTSLQSFCLMALAKIGDTSSIEAIRAWRKEVPRGQDAESEKAKDEEAEKTITAIQQRLKLPPKAK